MSAVCLELRSLQDLDHQALPFDSPHDGPSMTEDFPHSLDSDQDHKKWFAHAQQLDPRLGTLSYLPTEIREMIFTHTLFCHPGFSADGYWEYDHRLGSPFNVSTYFFDGCHRAAIDSRIGGLRQTSSSIKGEFEDAFLSKRNFRFNYPENLMAFITRLDESQSNRVFSITIGICLLNQVDDWMKPVAQLPPNLTEVQFKIYTAFNDYVQPDALSTLSDVMHEAARRVPNAKISVCSSGKEPLSQECQNLVTDFVQSQSQSQSHKQHPR